MGVQVRWHGAGQGCGTHSHREGREGTDARWAGLERSWVPEGTQGEAPPGPGRAAGGPLLRGGAHGEGAHQLGPGPGPRSGPVCASCLVPGERLAHGERAVPGV